MGRRRKRNRNRRNVLVKEIPQEIEFDILARLPVKSLLQLRCVCKRWCSIISDPCFAEAQFMRSRTRAGGCTLLISLPAQLTQGMFFLVYHLEQGIANPIHFLNQSGLSIHNVSESLNGIIFLQNEEVIYACNLSTREIIDLPYPNEDTVSSSVTEFYSFGYDPLRREHKILKTFVELTSGVDGFMVTRHKVLTVGTSLWRPIDSSPIDFPTKDSVCVNGAIHFRSTDFSGNTVIVAFDVGDEKFQMFPLPDETLFVGHKSSLIQHKGHLAVIDYEHLSNWSTMKIWSLDDYQNQVWTEETIMLPYNWMELRGNCDSFLVSSTHNGEILLTPRIWVENFYVFFYNLESKTLRKVEIPGLPQQMLQSLSPSFVNMAPINHVECILSLSQSI